MKRSYRRLLWGPAVLLLMPAAHAAAVEKFSFGRFGTTTIFRPAAVEHVALFFSDAGGWSTADARLAAALADRGVLVAGIDTRHYAAQLTAKPHKSCLYVAGEFEDFSHELQKHFSPQRYHLPVLVGRGYGASIVYAVAAQGSPGTFIGTLTMNFAPRWRQPVVLCQSYDLRYQVERRGIVRILPAAHLRTPWIDLHGSDLNRNPAAALLTNVAALTQRDRPPKVLAAELQDLPLFEVRATGTVTDRLALFLTGDGGWADLDKQVSTALARRGIDVVALSSLQYFWQPRSPDETAKDVARILRHYLAAWNKREALIVGYSFGADVAPFAINRLPADLRDRIAGVNLLGLSHTADFEVHVTTWLGVDNHGLPVQPEVERLPMTVLCIHGAGETDTVCTSLKGPKIQTLEVGDGHHFGDLYDELAEAVIRALPK